MPPPLLIDLTTTSEEVGRHPHGTTRVERGIVACLARDPRPGLGFVAWDRAARRFVAVPPAEALRHATAPTMAERGRAPEPAWLRHPVTQRLRALRRRVLAPWRQGRAAVPVAPPDDSAIPIGAILLIPAEANRQDFATLLRLKRTRGVRLVFLFFDLLRVLDDGDPRLSDPDACDLPPTDFMVREAALLLAISRFSAGELARHLARRGVAGPPVVVFRLAAEVPPAGSPVAGLAPGRFVLTVGDVVQRKNHALLLRVWRRWGDAALPLVIAGRVDAEGQDLAAAIAREPGLRIRLLPNADDGTLGWLYRHCRFTVFPSRLEGFGLPVAESLSIGKPCIASTATSIPEAGQGAAIGIDPDDDDAWLHAVRQLAEDDAALAEAAPPAYRPVTWADGVSDILTAVRMTIADA